MRFFNSARSTRQLVAFCYILLGCMSLFSAEVESQQKAVSGETLFNKYRLEFAAQSAKITFHRRKDTIDLKGDRNGYIRGSLTLVNPGWQKIDEIHAEMTRIIGLKKIESKKILKETYNMHLYSANFNQTSKDVMFCLFLLPIKPVQNSSAEMVMDFTIAADICFTDSEKSNEMQAMLEDFISQKNSLPPIFTVSGELFSKLTKNKIQFSQGFINVGEEEIDKVQKSLWVDGSGIAEIEISLEKSSLLDDETIANKVYKAGLIKTMRSQQWKLENESTVIIAKTRKTIEAINFSSPDKTFACFHFMNISILNPVDKQVEVDQYRFVVLTKYNSQFIDKDNYQLWLQNQLLRIYQELH